MTTLDQAAEALGRLRVFLDTLPTGRRELGNDWRFGAPYTRSFTLGDLKTLVAALEAEQPRVPPDQKGLARRLDDYRTLCGESELGRLLDEVARALRIPAPATGAGEGHNEPCFYCGEPCDRLTGDPSRWPLVFAQPDGTGIVRVHHVGCVVERLSPATGAGEAIAQCVKLVEARINQMGERADDPTLSEDNRRRLSGVMLGYERKATKYDILCLPPQGHSVYFVVRSIMGDDKETNDYRYEEGDCPTNFFLYGVQEIITNGDTDPHGLFEFVRSLNDPEFLKRAHNSEEEWLKVLPEAFDGGTAAPALPPSLPDTEGKP